MKEIAASVEHGGLGRVRDDDRADRGVASGCANLSLRLVRGQHALDQEPRSCRRFLAPVAEPLMRGVVEQKNVSGRDALDDVGKLQVAQGAAWRNRDAAGGSRSARGTAARD